MADVSNNIACNIKQMNLTEGINTLTNSSDALTNSSDALTEGICDLTKLSKKELLEKCDNIGITKCKSKTKVELIKLINSKQPKKLELLIQDDDIIEGNNENISKILMDVSKETNNVVITSASNEIKHLKPLIKWSGGKSDEIKMFEKYFPENYTTYIEPFVGGGSVYFYLNPINAVISDVHTELIDLYKSIGKGKGQNIYEFMKQYPNDENTY